MTLVIFYRTMLHRVRYCYDSSGRLSVCDVVGSSSHTFRLEYFEINFMAEQARLSCLCRALLHWM